MNSVTLLPLPEGYMLPPPLYEAHLCGTYTDREGTIYDMYIGLSEEAVSQLKTYSLDQSDTELQTRSSDYERFGIGSYEDWYEKGRTPFSLIEHATGTLAALIWIGPKAPDIADQGDSNWHTLAFRSYGRFRGKGIMKAFLAACVSVYRTAIPGVRFWTNALQDNAGSIKLSESIGLTPYRGNDEGAKRVIMIEQ